MKKIKKKVDDEICSRYGLVYDTNDTAVDSELPLYIMGTVLAILLIILFIMCESWFEPLIFLVTIGIAKVINTGTYAILGGVSNITKSIVSILQLVLSMDYSIILINRYRQEQACNNDSITAMTNAVSSAAASVLSSSLTTAVGLLSLVFMRFKIGADFGVVLAKGVFISMVCIFTVLPALILMCNGIIEKTAKKVPGIKMEKLAESYTKTKNVFPCLLIIFFAAAVILKRNTKINYSIPKPSEIVDIFPKANLYVVLYNNSDEKNIKNAAAEFENNSTVKTVAAYSTTLAKQ